jgi:hypothetical protein
MNTDRIRQLAGGNVEQQEMAVVQLAQRLQSLESLLAQLPSVRLVSCAACGRPLTAATDSGCAAEFRAVSFLGECICPAVDCLDHVVQKRLDEPASFTSWSVLCRTLANLWGAVPRLKNACEALGCQVAGFEQEIAERKTCGTFATGRGDGDLYEAARREIEADLQCAEYLRELEDQGERDESTRGCGRN